MADYDSSLPIRTENDGDVVAKISDATIPSQQLTVESDGSINVNAALPSGTAVEITDGADTLAVNADGSINTVISDGGGSITVDGTVSIQEPLSIDDNGGSITVDAVDLDVRDLDASQDNVAISDGTNTVAVNADGSLNITDNGGSITVDATSLPLPTGAATAANQLPDGHNVTVDNASGASAVNIQDGGNSITVDAVDLDIRNLSASQDNVAISDGADTLGINSDGSINVNVIDAVPGSEVVDYQTSSAVAKDASVNHDYTVTAANTFYGEEAWVSGSGKLKVEILIDGTTKFVGFNSTANPNVRIPLERIVTAAATDVVRITITNRDNQPQDVHSTLLGDERS